MKRIQTLTIALAGSAVLLTGCVNPNGTANNTGTGALVGGGIGAAAGAALGGRNALGGALIGGVLGAITGSIIGNQADQAQAEALRAQAPVTYVHVQQNQALTVEDVKALVQARVSDDAIISQIQNSHTIYHLTASQIIDLRNSGVSDRVINFMINTPSTITPVPQTTVVETDTAPPSPPPQPVVVSPGPGYLWINGDWQWNGGGWTWTAGRWVYPPWPGAVWIHGYWYRGPFGGWRHAHGHWR
jgi:WXXGXW repeat (2 copies)